MAATEAPQVAAAYRRLEECCAGASGRPPRRACPRLFRDVLAVACGLRPGFMLDYAALPPAQLAAAAAAVVAVLHLPLGELCVAALHDCCFLVCPRSLPDPEASPALAARGSSSKGQEPPMLVSFGPAGGDGVVVARWASPEEQSAARQQLAALRRHLLHVVGEAAAGAAQQGRQRSVAAALPVCDLGVTFSSEPALPTLAGFLLGYPVIYLLRDQEGAQAAARCLSSTSLALHTAAAQLKASSAAGLPAPEDSTLTGFSLPAELAGSAEWQRRWEEWGAALRARAQGAPLTWSMLQLRAAVQAPRAVAL